MAGASSIEWCAPSYRVHALGTGRPSGASQKAFQPSAECCKVQVERTTDLSGASGEEEGAAVEPPLVGLATLSVLATAAEAVPVLYIVDDAHWLDAATADALLLCAYRLVRTGWSWLELTAELTSDQLSGVELLPWLAASGRRDAGRARRR